MDEIDWDAWWFDNQYELSKNLREIIVKLSAGDKDKEMSLWAAVVETAAEEIRNLIPTKEGE